MENNKLVETIVKALDEKKGMEIKVLDIHAQTGIADYFIIASGRSTTQVHALCDNLEEFCSKEFGRDVLRREGVQEGRWAVLDFGEVIVHIFDDEHRLFYHLERLWGEGEKFVDQD